MIAPADRQILHVDMDAFFAAVEQRDRPELRGRPVLVGGSPTGRGVVSAASYEARPFGCRSAMPMAEALRRCPQAVVVRPRMGAYGEASRQVFAIFEHYTPLIEPLSIDEAFLEVTGSVRLLGAAPDIARDLRRRIREETSLTASVGVAPNKFLAKLASDLNKPDGLTIIEPDRIQAILDPLPISRLWGVGVKTLARLERMGLAIFADLRRLSEQELRTPFGQAGEHFYRLVRGLDDRPVVPDRRAKSISHETTFPQDLDHYDHLRSVLLHQAEQVAWRLRRHDLFARNVFIKVRTADFTTATRSRTLPAPTDRTDEFRAAAAELFDTWWHKRSARRRRIRLIGVGLSQLSASGQEQLSLFEADKTARSRSLDRTLDRIRERFGTDAVSRGGRPDDA